MEISRANEEIPIVQGWYLRGTLRADAQFVARRSTLHARRRLVQYLRFAESGRQWRPVQRSDLWPQHHALPLSESSARSTSLTSRATRWRMPPPSQSGTRRD